MAEDDSGNHRPAPSPGRPARRMPAPVRYLFVILAGAAVAVVTSYLLRKIGL